MSFEFVQKSSPLDAEGKKKLECAVFCFPCVLLGFMKTCRKNKVCQEIPFLSFFLFRSRFLFPCPEDILDKCKNETRIPKHVG
jgi:hypothetical protein